MMVTFGALKPHTQKKLCGRFRPIGRTRAHAIKIGRTGQGANGVQVNPTKELFITAQRGWRQAKVFPLRDQLGVYEIVLSNFRVGRQPRIGTGYSNDGDLTAKAKHDMSLASLLGS